jgi:hypothetical protein
LAAMKTSETLRAAAAATKRAIIEKVSRKGLR